MTPEQQRIAIALACPESLRQVNARWKYFDGTYWFNCKQDDPLTDLNAMHAAVQRLDREQRNRYINTLDEMALDSMDADEDKAERDFRWCHASAAQRAEAFLRTLNLWIPCAT